MPLSQTSKEVLGSAILGINKHQKDGAVDFAWGPRILLEAAPVGETSSQAEYRILTNTCTSFKVLLTRIQRIFYN